ncbi:uncharacterized protein LOC116775281 isoform X2 [Danaus plexippus]|uniref:uncharacterized protein LOC116775281 isoform X2 n=1 Tax=Danaus plexippus TaxID=13037 RepID=UPI002AAFB67D|nr:uncharacterized protein LOC116775281 isoform X2 [Danaus plexippus]
MELEDETAYQQPDSSVEYCSVTQLLQEKDYMQNIVTEIEKNYEITKKIKLEENYITTIALSNRQDIVNDVINYDFEIYEKYEDIVKKFNITLTNDIQDYCGLDSHYLLIKLTVTNVHQKFNDVLSNMFGNLEMHITLFSSNKVLKNITLKIYEQLKCMNIAVPVQTVVLENKKLTVLIELIIKIPGALEKKQSLWIKLHTKEAILNAEHFIKTIIPTNNICHLKKTPDITSLICENAIKHHGHLVKLINVDNKNSVKWKFFTILPENYKQILSNEQSYKCLNSVQRKLVMKELSSDSFLSSRNTVVLNVANEKVEIDINTGFPNDFLQITSVNVQIASDIRMFLSNILFVKQELTKDYVSATILNTMEVLKQQINDCVSNLQPIENFLPLHEKYQKNVICRLNL